VADIDTSTWQALGLTLTLLGLVASVLLWRRRGPASGLRGIAWSLLPLAAALTGVLRLAWEIADSVVDWALRLVFSPVVWSGVALAGVSLVLFVVSGFLRRRAAGRGGRSAEAGTGELTDRSRRPAATAAGTSQEDDELDDIEAILRKHGIT
jgi:heme exporter protein D